MKVISNGNNIYHIYNDSCKTYDALPAQNYVVRFSQQQGFFLELYSEIEIKDEKIYGVHEAKVNKVLNSFKAFNRNLGVILSGDKGIGKSLFAKLLSAKAVSQGIPMIVVDTYIPGIAAYLDSIKQEVVILFDEFDKTFDDKKTGGGQDEMLSLFDGVAQGKKMFVITCNNLWKLNDYLVNRPGRFHYHFRFEYPSATEIEEYLKDKLDESLYGEIERVIGFSKKVKLNYDCLRAIAFEISNTGSFEEAIKDLNIVNTDSEEYNVTLHFEDGTTLKKTEVELDLFNDNENIYFYSRECSYCYVAHVEFDPTESAYDMRRGTIVIDGSLLNVEINPDADYDSLKPVVEKLSKTKASHMTIALPKTKGLHYKV